MKDFSQISHGKGEFYIFHELPYLYNIKSYLMVSLHWNILSAQKQLSPEKKTDCVPKDNMLILLPGHKVKFSYIR